MFFVNNTMSTSVPDGISTEALQALMFESQVSGSAPLADASPKELVEFVASLVDAGYEQMGTVFAFKLMADYCLFQLYQHHHQAFLSMLEDGETEGAAAWCRDAGQLQVLAKTLQEIHTGPQDFQCPED